MTSERSATHVVGIDVGGTKTLAALIRVTGVGSAPILLDSERCRTRADADQLVADIEGAVSALLDRSEVAVSGIGVGLAGFVDRDGVVRRAPNCGGLVGLRLGELLEQRFGLPVVIDNDANCVAVLAHHVLAPDCADLLAVTLGTGIGGGLVVGGRLLRGFNGFAGEPGHMVIDPDGPECPCGQRGCWERFASGAGLAWLARRAVDAGHADDVLAAAGAPDAVRGDHVTDLIQHESPGALEVFAEYAGYVALGLANLILVLDPGTIVIGGGISNHGDRLGALITRALDERFPSAVVGREVEIVMTPGGPEAGAMGAGLLGAYRITAG